MVKRLGDDAIGAGMNNVAFLTRFLSGDLNACLEILINTQRIPEAAFFARTYLPSQISRVVQLWKLSLSQVNAKASQSLADPAQYDNLFPGLMDALKTEQFLEQRRQQLPASAYSSLPNNWERHPVEEMRLAEQNDQFHHVTPAKVSFVEEEKEVEETHEQMNSNPSANPLPIPEPTVVATTSQPKNLLDDDEEDFQPAVSESVQGTSQLDQDLELDLENLELDDNVDTSEVNLDDDLLDD
jgi:coatomer subunit beta'